VKPGSRQGRRREDKTMEKVTVYVRADNPEKNKIGIYKKYIRALREDSAGYYVKINNMKAYLQNLTDNNTAFVKYWI
jgi:hypothetical protein